MRRKKCVYIFWIIGFISSAKKMEQRHSSPPAPLFQCKTPKTKGHPPSNFNFHLCKSTPFSSIIHFHFLSMFNFSTRETPSPGFPPSFYLSSSFCTRDQHSYAIFGGGGRVITRMGLLNFCVFEFVFMIVGIRLSISVGGVWRRVRNEI